MSKEDWKTVPEEQAKCRHCESNKVKYRTVTSFDEAHEDVNFQCQDCKGQWWVDGPDY